MELFKFIALVVAGALWCAVLVAFLHKKDVHPIRELLDGFGRLGWMCKVGILFLVVQMTMFGGAKHGGTNDVDEVDGTNVVTEVSGTNEVGEVESGVVENGEAESGEAVSAPLQGNELRGPFLSGRPSQSLTSGEDTASPLLSAQIELFRNGDFITRSNNVESVFRRVIEPNPDPLNPYGPVQDLSVIDETNTYCWVDIVVNNADAWVRFEGDGPSNLADPSFAAKVGETNHVVILIGKTYKVTCDMQFSVVGKSDPDIDAWWEDDHTLWLNWPVTIEAWEGNGKSFMMHVVPNCLAGIFSWTNSCCSVSGSGTRFSYSCDEYCHCTGSSASGYYGYEGYSIGCYGGWCGCSYDPGEWEGGGLSLKKVLMLQVSPLCFLMTLLYLKTNFKTSQDFMWVAVRPKPFSNVSFTEVRMGERQLSLLRDETDLTV